MKKIILIIFAALAAVCGASAWDLGEKYKGPKTPETDLSWHPDILPGYEARYVNQG